MNKNKVIIIFNNYKKNTTVDIEVPLDITATELVVALPVKEVYPWEDSVYFMMSEVVEFEISGFDVSGEAVAVDGVGEVVAFDFDGAVAPDVAGDLLDRQEGIGTVFQTCQSSGIDGS